MASKLSKTMPFNSSATLFFIACLFLAINYIRQLHNEFQKATYPESFRIPGWFDVVAPYIRDEKINIGLVNIDGVHVDNIDLELKRRANMVKVHFNPVVDYIRWKDFFPVWINEKYPSKCPEIQMPRFEDYHELDVILARVPCSRDDEGRDVLRLQVNLVVANLLVRSRRKNNSSVFAVFTGSCTPMWEIFRCDDLLWHEGNYWVYKPELTRLQQKVLMPVGTCQLAPAILEQGQKIWRKYNNTSQSHTLPQPREAYVTVLHSSENYVCGAIALAQSIMQTNTTKDLVLLADVDSISQYSLEGLREAGWKIKPIRRIRSSHSERHAYNEYNYSKLRIWQLKNYDKVMFIDSDLIVLKNIDKFFNYPQLSAVRNHEHIFNSGLMLIEPSTCTFKTLMKKRFAVASYNGGDQGFLNEIFPWWHLLPAKLNQFKYFDDINDQLHEIPHDMYAVHYFGIKPWTCYQDYDCNWDRLKNQIYASDMAHEKWWNVYKDMPKKLKKYCSLTSEMDARIQMNRAKAKNATFIDGHWKIKVKDPRRLSILSIS
ncbi:unnamed protein product [Fraxinus pennsylvanica]|uniref:Hexosyltransferase n=1 Tax=Fraxinus pennsylvanica TaxID=56036 RepID=A0AAD2DX16_9LAMI|nr:unnamed protein product [Fraxinus pennsylvanica]